MSSNPDQGGGLAPISLWVRHRSVAYFRGRGILFGADAELFPRKAIAPGKFPIYADVAPHPAITVCDDDLAVCANGAFDYVFVGRRLGIAKSEPREFLKECVKKLKIGGHLIVFMPIGAPEKRSFTPDSVKELVGTTGSWRLKEALVKDNHLLQIYKYEGQGRNGITERKRSGKPRACIARYGALGDMIMVTPLIRKLHEDGYEVTVNLSPYSLPVLDNNPYVSNIIIQERDAIPNHTLGQYWHEWEGEYDKYINLSESIEGALLKVEGRRNYFTHKAWRHGETNKNYYDFTMELGGYPNATGLRGELFFSRDEIKEAKHFRSKLGDRKLVVCALNGSSFHKRYGLLKPVLSGWLDANPDVTVVTVGDNRAVELEFDHKQVIRAANKWPVRHSMCMTQFADLVVGPESMMVNAASCYDTPKITFLSHSTHENLCKYWSNDYCMEPDQSLAPCYPCHQLHYTEASCPLTEVLDESGSVIAHGPICAMGAISGERVQQRMSEALNRGTNRSMDPSAN